MGIHCENPDGSRFGTEVHYRIMEERYIFVPSMEARDQEYNLCAYEMAPNPCARGGGAVVDNGPSSGGEVSKYHIYIYIAYVYRLWPVSQ